MSDFKDPIIQLKGKKVVYIENFKKLLDYHKYLVRVLTKTGIVEVYGQNFVIRYYSKEDMEIRGLIEKICFIDS